MIVFAYSFFYFSYFCIIAAQIGFIPIHAELLGFTGISFALIAGCSNLGTLLGAPISLSLSRHKLSPYRLLPFLMILGVCSALPLLYARSFIATFSTLLAAMACSAGALAIVDFYASRSAALGLFRYERVRIWGSIGFIVGSFLLGWGVDLSGKNSIVFLTLMALVVTAVGAFLLSKFLPDAIESDGFNELDESLFPWKIFLPLLFAVIFSWASHAALYTYLSVHLREHGWTGIMISAVWNWGVICELFCFALFYKLENIFSTVTILRLSLAAAVVRWLLTGHAESVEMFFACQSLHAFTFATMLVSSLKLIHSTLPERFRSRGLSMWASLGSGGGVLAGRLFLGGMSSIFGTEVVTIPLLFSVASMFAMLGLICTFFIYDRSRINGL